MLKVKVKGGRPNMAKVFKELSNSPKLKAKGNLSITLSSKGESNKEIDEEKGKFSITHPKLNKVQIQNFVQCFIVAQHLLKDGKNSTSWRKHWKPNKRLLVQMVADNKPAIKVIKDIFGNVAVEEVGLGAALRAYADYSMGKMDKKMSKMFKDTFLNFFKVQVAEIKKPIEAQDKLERANAILAEFADLPDKGVSTNFDEFLPDALVTTGQLFQPDSKGEPLRVEALLDRLDVIEMASKGENEEAYEEAVLNLVSDIEEKQIENFMKQVLGQKDEKTNKRDFPNYKAKEYQAAQETMLKDFLGNIEPAADNDAEEKPARFISDLNSEAMSMEKYPVASVLSGDSKAKWKKLSDSVGWPAGGVDSLFEPQGKDGDGYGFDWYGKTSSIYEDFKILAQKGVEAGFDEDDISTLLSELKDQISPPIPEPETPIIAMGPTKGASRAIQKIEKYGQDISRLSDIVRFTAVIDSSLEDFGEVFEGLKSALAANGAEIATAPENRYAEPTPTGYGDLVFFVRYESGVIGEVQITTPIMAAAKERIHHYYEEQRNIDSAGESMAKINKIISEGSALSDNVLIATLKDHLEDTKDKLVTQANDKHKQQMSELFDGLYGQIETMISGESPDVGAIKSLIKKKANSYDNIQELHEYEQLCWTQLDGYGEARKNMGLELFIPPFPFRTKTTEDGGIEFNDGFYDHVREQVEEENEGLEENQLDNLTKQILLSRQYDKKKYGVPLQYTEVESEYASGRRKLGSMKVATAGQGGHFKIEGIPYSWDGFMTLPKFFTGENPYGETDHELADFLVKATPISEDEFNSMVAELTMEYAQKREDKLALGERVIEELKKAKTKMARKASINKKKEQSLRNKIIRLAYTKPELRKSLLPLLTKKAADPLTEFLVIDLKDQLSALKVSPKFKKDLDLLEEGERYGIKDFLSSNKKELLKLLDQMKLHPMRKKDLLSMIK